MMMTRRVLPVLLACLCVTAWAADLVKNADFSAATPGQPTVPADWTLPADGSWQRVVGADGQASLRYQAPAGLHAPARGKCDFLSPRTNYTIEVTYEGDGVLTPVLRMMDLPSNTPLARAVGARAAGLQKMGVSFAGITADVGLEIFADVAHADGQPGPAGQLRVLKIAMEQTSSQTLDVLPDIGPNLALHKPYTMDPPPGYADPRDEGDAVQLTDGVYTQGHFWTRKTTVGWGTQNVLITIDLGQDQPLQGLSLNTAGGIADVHWPLRILIFVSPDGKQWYDAGNLMTLNEPHHNLPAYGQYAIRHIWTDALNTHGRYVALFIEPPRPSYVVLDEIEVYGGPPELLAKPYRGLAFASPKEHIERLLLSGVIQDQFRRELDAVSAVIATLPAYVKVGYEIQALQLRQRIDEWTAPDMEGFRAVLPVDDLERDIFRLLASVWRAQNKPSLRVWNMHRWEMLNPYAEPAEGPNTVRTLASAGRIAGIRPLEVHLMNHEWRAGTINLTNASDQPLPVRLRVTGLPGGDNPPYLTVREVLTVGTRRFVPVSAALPDAAREGKDYVVTVPSGMTRQVWLSFKPENLPAKTHAGQIVVTPATGAKQVVPLKLVVYPLRFPDETTLCLGGWEESDTYSYGITKENKAAVIEHLKEHYVNTPWANNPSVFSVQVDDSGQIIQPADTTRFDTWIKLWPRARMYMVFLNAPDNFCGAKIGTPEFKLKVGAWARFWAQHMRDLGKRPNQLGLLIYDEPNKKSQYDLIVAWANALEAGAPELVTWEDPQPTEYVDAPIMFAAVDVLCPYRNPFLARDQQYRDLFLKAGKELWFYNADGPARSFDPFSFYLVQEWHCFAIGAKGTHFWAFGDNGRVSCWNEYPAQGNGPYCPSYIDATSVTTSKYMEAIREGVQDYEYLTMLQARVAELEKKGVKSPALAAAKRLLIEGPQRVLAGEKGANYRWDEPKNRAVQDEVRIEVLRALVALK
jgi:hypothetical protein